MATKQFNIGKKKNKKNPTNHTQKPCLVTILTIPLNNYPMIFSERDPGHTAIVASIFTLFRPTLVST